MTGKRLKSIFSHLPLFKGENKEPFRKRMQQSSPPFEKGGREGFLADISKNQIAPEFIWKKESGESR